MVKKWEYKVVDLDYQTDQGGNLKAVSRDDLREELLNSLGQEGWELVAIATYSGEDSEATTAYFKREVS